MNHYLTEIISKCPHCVATSAPAPDRKVSLKTMTREFNDTVCVDHIYLQELRLCHVIHTVSRYSAVHVTPTPNMFDSIIGFQAYWRNQLWPSATIRIDLAFDNTELKSFCRQIGADSEPVPPSRHNKNVLESKHGIIRSI